MPLHGAIRLPLWYPQQVRDVLQRILKNVRPEPERQGSIAGHARHEADPEVYLYRLHAWVGRDGPSQRELPRPGHVRVRRVEDRIRRQPHGNLGDDSNRRDRALEQLENSLLNQSIQMEIRPPETSEDVVWSRVAATSAVLGEEAWCGRLRGARATPQRMPWWKLGRFVNRTNLLPPAAAAGARWGMGRAPASTTVAIRDAMVVEAFVKGFGLIRRKGMEGCCRCCRRRRRGRRLFPASELQSGSVVRVAYACIRPQPGN